MKKTLLSGALLILPLLGFSQMGVPQTVYDPTAAANMTTQIKNTSTQIVQLEKSLQYMEKASETMNAVSGYVRDASIIKDITDMYKESIMMASKIRAEIPKIKNPDTQKRVLGDLIRTIAILNKGISFTNSILSDNFFKMTDKDRLDLLNTERRKILIQRSRLAAYMQ